MISDILGDEDHWGTWISRRRTSRASKHAGGNQGRRAQRGHHEECAGAGQRGRAHILGIDGQGRRPNPRGAVRPARGSRIRNITGTRSRSHRPAARHPRRRDDGARSTSRRGRDQDQLLGTSTRSRAARSGSTASSPSPLRARSTRQVANTSISPRSDLHRQGRGGQARKSRRAGRESPRVLTEGQEVKVKLPSDRGKVRLSMRVVDQDTGAELEDTRPPREPREGGGPRGDRDRGPRRDGGGGGRDRGPRRDGGGGRGRDDRGPRGEGGDRGDRGPRRDREGGPAKEEGPAPEFAPAFLTNRDDD